MDLESSLILILFPAAVLLLLAGFDGARYVFRRIGQWLMTASWCDESDTSWLTREPIQPPEVPPFRVVTSDEDGGRYARH